MPNDPKTDFQKSLILNKVYPRADLIRSILEFFPQEEDLIPYYFLDPNFKRIKNPLWRDYKLGEREEKTKVPHFFIGLLGIKTAEKTFPAEREFERFLYLQGLNGTETREGVLEKILHENIPRGREITLTEGYRREFERIRYSVKTFFRKESPDKFTCMRF